MAISKGYRFPMAFADAFPKGLALVGEIGPDTVFQQDRSKPAPQKVDEQTGKRIWKATVTDPDETKGKRSSFELFFLADVVPVPVAAEVMPGFRPIELDGLTAEAKVAGQGEFKYLAYTFRATGITGDTNAPGKPAAAARHDGSKAGA